jgi:pimeloyl-ACP methyl ester carboxylesterase
MQRRLLNAVMTGDSLDQIKEELRQITIESINNLPPDQRAMIEDPEGYAESKLYEIDMMRSNWYMFFLRYNPSIAYRKTVCPVLAFFGENDKQVTVSANLEPMKTAFEKAQNKKFTYEIIPSANHLYQISRTGSVTEYASLKKEFSPVFLEKLTEWLKKTTK